MDEKLEAKKRLYHLLLQEANPTEAEVNIMYHLALDSQVREFLEQQLKKG